jgi:hypothetical protein
MKELKICYNDTTHIYHLPESIKEMTGKQLIEAIKYRNDKMAQKIASDSFFQTLCSVNKEEIKLFFPYLKYKLEQFFEYLLDKEWEESFLEQKFRKVNINEKEFCGYDDNFGNTTWEEFIWADQLFIIDDYKKLIACLYREKRENYNGETDTRIPFTTYGIAKRFTIVNTLDDATLYALVFQYKAMRKASLEAKYTQIFPEAVKYESDEPEPEPEPNNFSWVRVHRNILGDNIQHEKDYLQLNVHTVLNRLNEAIIESKKPKKN